jgi:hypothetical protein
MGGVSGFLEGLGLEGREGGSGAHVIFEEVEYFSRPEKRTMLITVMLNVSRGNVRGGIVS